MTKHRIQADKVVIENDRRVLRKDANCIYSYRQNDRRKSPHDYTQKHKIIYIPVEPQPYLTGRGHLAWNKKVVRPEAGDFAKILLKYSPFHPDDTLILLEEWVEKEAGNIIARNAEFSDTEYGNTQSAATMPPELDSQCQQYNVVKVLGVDEKMMSPDPLADGMWHWEILTKEKGEVANETTP